jgi:Ca-activated chloride channel family protein
MTRSPEPERDARPVSGGLRSRRAAALLFTAACSAALAAQAPGDTHLPTPRFSAQVQFVEVYASVTDAAGRPLAGLRQDDFEVREDGGIERVTAFAAGEFPLAVALGVDRSWSMNGEPLRLTRLAAQSFLLALRPLDRSMVVAISSEAEVLAPLSIDREAQIRAVAALDAWGTTALHDAILASLDRLAPEQGRQALVVLSDGIDRYSKATAAEVVDRARRGHAIVYPIALGRTRPPALVELATLTGGRSFLLRDARDLEATLTAIAGELRHQYLLGYRPSRPFTAGGQWRSIHVSLTGSRPGVRVRARDGYVAE